MEKPIGSTFLMPRSNSFLTAAICRCLNKKPHLWRRLSGSVNGENEQHCNRLVASDLPVFLAAHRDGSVFSLVLTCQDAQGSIELISDCSAEIHDVNNRVPAVDRNHFLNLPIRPVTAIS